MDDSADFGQEPNALPDFSQSDIDAVKTILKNMKYQVNSETQIMKIIKEEAAAYFAGQKSAEEVSDIIQSRVQVYLKENE
jgi:glutamyl-tRNA reductase